MTLTQDLLRIEQRFWTGGPEAYLEHVDEECLVVFADMAQVMKRGDIAKTAEGGRWRDVDMKPKGQIEVAPDCVVIAYEIQAVRAKDGTPHCAYCSSLYVRRGGDWKLAFHQQTPIPAA